MENFILTDNAKKHFKTLAKWAKFLALFSIIINVLMILVFAVFHNQITEVMNMAEMTDSPFGGSVGQSWIFYIIAGAFGILVSVFLLKFSNNIKSWLSNQNNDEYNIAIQNLYQFWMIAGISMVLTLVFTLYTAVQMFI